MKQEELNQWWSRLTVAEKDRIASKLLTKQQNRDCIVCYPESTRVWQKLSVERQEEIYRHVTDDHGVLLKEWQEGASMSY